MHQILKFIYPKIACCCGTKTFGTQTIKNWRVRTIFWSWDVENVHATVARRELVSQYEQNTPCSDHFFSCERFVCNGGVRQLVNYSFTQFVNRSTSQWPNLSSSELVNQSVRQLASQLISFSINQVAKSAGQSVSPSVHPSVSQSMSQLVSQLVSQLAIHRFVKSSVG